MPANTRVDFTGLKQQHLGCDSQTNTLKETQIVIYSQIIFLKELIKDLTLCVTFLSRYSHELRIA